MLAFELNQLVLAEFEAEPFHAVLFALRSGFGRLHFSDSLEQAFSTGDFLRRLIGFDCGGDGLVFLDHALGVIWRGEPGDLIGEVVGFERLRQRLHRFFGRVLRVLFRLRLDFEIGRGDSAGCDTT